MSIKPISDINTKLIEMIRVLGCDGIYTCVKSATSTTPATSYTVRGVISQIERRDTDLIQAYGVNGTRITFKQDSFIERPYKFDSWRLIDRKYVFDGVLDIIISGKVVGYTVYCKGIAG